MNKLIDWIEATVNDVRKKKDDDEQPKSTEAQKKNRFKLEFVDCEYCVHFAVFGIATCVQHLCSSSAGWSFTVVLNGE